MAVEILFFFYNDTSTTEIYTLSLHDALPISTPIVVTLVFGVVLTVVAMAAEAHQFYTGRINLVRNRDRKSTRLNSSHMSISYAVFCLKKKIYISYKS